MKEIYEKLLILRTPKIGPIKYAELLQQYGSDSAILESLDLSDDFEDSVKREMDLAYNMGIEYICDNDSRYPCGLLNIKNHPVIISVRGNIETLNKKSVSIVGTRHSTAAGMNFVSDLSSAFAEHDFVVTSGMAMGTDTAAHTGALKVSGKTQTIAVLAGGVDYIWPLENESLYYEILERGAVISEMPVGTKPIASNFVQRNRWVAGLSDFLIISEADMKSGSMTTVRFAKDYGKQVFAVPGHPSDPRSIGPNYLIKSGEAILCMSKTDFFDDEKTQNMKKSYTYKNDILDKLGIIPVSESVLANLVKKSVSEIKSDLVVLELQGLIRKQDGGYVLN
nr:DNA-processing protein DprA [Candidatus Enterousia merdequi]